MSLAILVAVAILGAALYWFITRNPKTSLNQDYYRQQWQQALAQAKHKQTLSLAIIEADKLLDKALKESGFKGSTMAERLVSAGSVFSNKDNVWSAHKLRNQLVHESGVKLLPPQAKKALRYFHKSLKDLGAI